MTANLKNKDYEQLGRMLMHIYETGYADRKKFYKYTFLKGLITGFGGVLGATILIGLLIWVLSLFEYVPFVRFIVDDVQETIKTQ